MIEAIGHGIVNVLNPGMLPWIFLGVMIGLIVGILPGLGGTAALAILLPVIYGLDPTFALSFLIIIHAAVSQGGLITSILFGVPGESASTATILDGYPMTKQGKAGRALGSALMASMMGALFGGVVLGALLPIAKPIVLAFGSPELFMMAVMGISFVAVLGRGSARKAFISGALGILVAFVGFHSGTGVLRYTGGMIYFWEGIKIVPVFMGLFAIPEVIELAVKGGAIAKVEKSEIKWNDVGQGIKDVFKNWSLVLRCSAIGAGIGIVPGVGGVVSQFITYGHAKQTSKRPQEFGLGCVEGVIAPESGNNAKEGGALLTTLAFGIPGSAAMVIILAALMVLGVKPGPDMMIRHLDLVWTIVAALILGNVVSSCICLLAARELARITFLKGTILVPLIIVLVILGAYGVANDIRDVLVAFAFGGIGYLMKIYDYSRVTFTIGFVLGDYAERYFLISLASLGPGFLLSSPISIVLLLLVILGLVGGHGKRLLLNLFQRQKKRKN
ncbi:MAG: tripartite tricarboxylate transporter permease [Thermodesulfobacteriota bacterium]|nr:tripartite tricarboxylate transporter permease [Thermodesulfobacteriota bacterium]